MGILIDLSDETVKKLSHLALDANTNRKNYIESVLVTHVGGGFKAKKPSTKRSTKKWTSTRLYVL